MSNTSPAFDARGIDPEIHDKLKRAASWLGKTQREFLSEAILREIERLGVPEIVINPALAPKLVEAIACLHLPEISASASDANLEKGTN